VTREPLEEAVKLDALGGREWGEQVVLGLGDGSLGLDEPPLAARREADEVTPPVGGVTRADDEAVGLERVEQPDEVARVDPERAAELLLGKRSGLVEMVENRELVRAHLERRERLGEAEAGYAGEAEDQHRVTGRCGRLRDSGACRRAHPRLW
jgi:hypothetical protein